MNTWDTRKNLVATLNGFSPLKKFTQCKDEISRQFVCLKEVIEGTSEFLSELERFDMDPNIKEQKAIHEFQEVVDNIMALLRRDNMKVVFVGHTSNGKSTVINGMLWQAVLPVGIGHTTSCFCSVQGTDEQDYMMVGEDGGRQSVTNVKQVAHALQANKENGQNKVTDKGDLKNMVRVFWQKRMCRLLGDGVVLIDTPGLDMDEHYDDWIDRFCHDADVFVLVANAEATLKHTEKSFFTEVAKKLSKPNVFLLYNRWDISDDADDTQAVLEQHFNKGAAFLTQELGLNVDPSQHIFFVSGKEVLLHRTKKDRHRAMEHNPNAQDRYKEFQRFEKLFEECISESAIRTKFEAHIVRGLDILVVLEEWMGRLAGEVKHAQKLATARLDDRRTSLKQLEENGGKVCEDCEQCAEQLEGRVQAGVSEAFEQLVNNQLYSIVAQFDFYVFKPETVAKYKERLLEHVGKMACEALRQHSDSGVATAYRGAQQTMVAKVQTILADRLVYSIHQFSRPLVTPDQLTTGVLDSFKEDIEFRFSLGWQSLGPAILGGGGFSMINGALTGKGGKGAMAGDGLSLAASILNPTSIVSLTTVLVTLVTKPSVWKVVLTVSGLYGALYAWEYLSYTNAAKERRFKGQFMAHVANHFRHVAPQLSMAAGRMYGGSVRDIQLKNVMCQIDEVKGALRREKATLEKDIADRGRVIQHVELTMDRAQRVHREMESFYQANICRVAMESVDP